ncbi:MAG: hypothetical protein PHV32_19590, partial [Eubacteriales bacterium]|nr:hypothetical protein [Eubacteriales bacterium]
FPRFERRMSSESNNCGYYGSNSATRYRVDRIEKLEKELEKIIENSPEAWEFYYKRKLISDIETQHQQRLVTVPYVVKAKQKVIDSLNLGVPVDNRCQAVRPSNVGTYSGWEAHRVRLTSRP